MIASSETKICILYTCKILQILVQVLQFSFYVPLSPASMVVISFDVDFLFLPLLGFYSLTYYPKCDATESSALSTTKFKTQVKG